ncbi:hypothetical protein HIM_02513 [Hirsutella minnesotensis 3608]|nr:hypothetical protein HIM_02513 [Hirsutella minnesotensis 3608]
MPKRAIIDGRSSYVGNKIAVFVLQMLGCDVAALNTVQFSNHTGYRQWTGTKASAAEIADLYRGLRQSFLDDFDMMLSGYVPGAEAVAAVGDIGKELKDRARASPGSFFWVLDPVMGDNGKLYVAEDVVPAYKALVPHADLILPNQFEAELLSGVSIQDMDTLAAAIQALHDEYHVPHVIITSVRLPARDQPEGRLLVVGSSMTSAGRARLFKIVFPSIDCYFCGTGDMFGALVATRMREAPGARRGEGTRQHARGALAHQGRHARRRAPHPRRHGRRPEGRRPQRPLRRDKGRRAAARPEPRLPAGAQDQVRGSADLGGGPRGLGALGKAA